MTNNTLYEVAIEVFRDCLPNYEIMFSHGGDLQDFLESNANANACYIVLDGMQTGGNYLDNSEISYEFNFKVLIKTTEDLTYAIERVLTHSLQGYALRNIPVMIRITGGSMQDMLSNIFQFDMVIA